MQKFNQSLQTYFDLKTNDLEKISSYFKTETIEKGEFFLRAGNQCKKLSFISDGIFRIYNSLDGKEITQWISTPGYFVTEISSFMFETPSRWEIQALSKSTLFTISKENYNSLNQEIENWNAIEKAFIAKCFAMLEDRVFSHLSMSAEERFEFFFHQNRALFNEIPQQYIASMLGMSPETLSRIRNKSLTK
jgi:CRP-like cAMP-binding protein